MPQLINCCTNLSLDIVAIQELGNPSLLQTRLSQSYQLIYQPGPSKHQSGVGLLISTALLPNIRTYHYSKSGRIIGIQMELNKNYSILIISVYMPTGLDHRSSESEEHKLAHDLYIELLQWCKHKQQIIVLGDLNETVTSMDRYPISHLRHPHQSPANPIQHLIRDNFIDVYRTLYPNIQINPGFTHFIQGSRMIRSRLDYIWCKGINKESVLQIHIDSRLRSLSHHRLVWMELQIDSHRQTTSTSLHNNQNLYQLQLPNLRAASEKQISKFTSQLNRQLEDVDGELTSLAAYSNPESVGELAMRLACYTRTAAFDCLPITGAAPLQNRNCLQLQRQRKDLTTLIHLTHSALSKLSEYNATSNHHYALMNCPKWCQQYQHCQLQYHQQLQWNMDPISSPYDWLSETRQLLRHTRSQLKQLQKSMLKQPRLPSDVNPAALTHQMLKSESAPSDIYSVVGSDGHLTNTPDELANVMVQHFKSVFSIPLHDEDQVLHLDHPPPQMLFKKPNINPNWYNPLMQDISEEELMQVSNLSPLVSAPGEDDVSSGVWKIAIKSCKLLRSYILLLFNHCLHSCTFASAWKTSIIVPLIKDIHKERTMNNIRPISLQNCLGKLLNTILAHRLGSILSNHPILNSAQRGFILGGTINKCIDELLDAWDWSRIQEPKKEIYTLFYDIKQAYDSVQVDVLTRALRRLQLPENFIQLVENSLTGLSSKIRTCYGLTPSLQLERSVRQGDPLSPLLFVILMDPLHDGLECNPFTGEKLGLTIALPDSLGVFNVPSLGYADDTSVLTNSLEALYKQNIWVHYFMTFNHLRLNPTKCELVGRLGDGNPLTAIEVARYNIAVEGQLLVPLAHDKSIRYLGVHVRFDGDWSVQQHKAYEKIAVFTRAIDKFNVPLNHATYMFNTFLLPMLELSLHYVHGPGTSKWIKKCDRLLVGCIKHSVHSLLKLSNSAVALSLHFNLPSWMEICIKVSELFIRLNSLDCRWGSLGRALWRWRIGAQLNSTSSLARPEHALSTLQHRTAYLAVHKLGWSLQLADSITRIAPLLTRAPSLLASSECSSSCTLALSIAQDRRVTIAQDVWPGWGTNQLRYEIHTYTDGSYDSGSSSWSTVIGDAWLHSHYDVVPANEMVVDVHHVRGAALFGSNIECTKGIYPAELQAIARTLAMNPLSATLHIHADSLASIAAINSFTQQINERHRLRMSSRPLLQLIRRQIQLRKDAGGSVHFFHVKAHTTNTDIHSV
ncbi:MAG TPA: reverse transcriptase domain-containing protein, partial [Candidatus Babeliaceae bacterium]|nr:reverse transcriptase domain-containing protein [Candidatus Babeliaceae bacterium]